MKKGYTLVELLVVVVIIGILTTIAFVGFGKIQADARDQKRESNATILSEALEKYYEKNGEYPSVAALTATDISQLKTLLGISDSDVLVMPTSPTGTTTSIVGDPELAATDKLAYNGESVSSSEADQCQTNASGGCDQFKLQWINENGEHGEIQSRHSGRDVSGALLAPKDPIMSVALSGGNIVGTVTFNMSDGQPVCATGTVGYKIITSTSSISSPDWASVNWQSTTTKSIASPVSGTEYFFYAIARCTSGASEAINNNEAEDSIYYSLVTMTAAWSGTSAVGTVGTSAPPICGSGLTAKYFIEYKIDTTAATGTWTTGQNWTTSPSHTIANATSSNPRKFSFRAQVRCDSGATPGTASGVTNTDSVVSAPIAPVVSNSSTTTTTTWTWPSASCPVGTNPVYEGARSGDYNSYPAMSNTITSGVNLTSTSQGFTYGLIVKASCGNATAKVIQSTSSDSTYYRAIPRAPFRTGKAGIKTYTPSGGSSTLVYVNARVDTLQPTSGNSYVSCAAGLTRVVGWATSKNNALWDPNYDTNATVKANPSQWTKSERSWSYGTSQNFYYNSDLDNGDQLEARFLVRCKNGVTSKYSPPARDDYPYDDRIGNLYLNNGSGEYKVLCDITGSAGASLKRPIWCSTGYTSSGNSTSQCHTENPDDKITGTMYGCWSKITNKSSWSWSWAGDPPPNVNDPSNAPYDGESGFDAPSTWGKMN